MSTRKSVHRLPTRIEEEIHVFNMSLPFHVKTPEESQENFCEHQYEPLMGELLRICECPVCRCIPSPPIYNCANGHISCSSCLPRLPSQKCGYCLASFTKMRNYPLENLVEVEVFLCDFQNAGCIAKNMKMGEYEMHVKSCSFRPREPLKTSPSFTKPPLLPRNCNDEILQEIDQFYSTCPRCTFLNSKRKLKCQSCELNLRVATPMCGRHVLGGAGNNQLTSDNI